MKLDRLLVTAWKCRSYIDLDQFLKRVKFESCRLKRQSNRGQALMNQPEVRDKKSWACGAAKLERGWKTENVPALLTRGAERVSATVPA